MIYVDHASKRFPGKNGTPVTALRDIALEIEPGEFVMIAGPSGSGKSTLLFTIGGMQHPTEGRVLLADTDVYGLSPSKRAALRRARIGFVFQTFNLMPRSTAFENVELPLIYAGLRGKERRDRVWEALRAVGLEERSSHRPNELSGGQRQRVAIARALVNHPSLILADEPTGNLDSKTSREIMDVFGMLHDQGNTIIVVTHEDEISRYSKRIVRLRDGRVEMDTAVQNAPS